jgi:hypothetical protein
MDAFERAPRIPIDWPRFTVAFVMMVAITSAFEWLPPAAENTAGGSTDWWVFGATAALALITLGLVVAALRALRQLDEAKRDRHTQIFLALARRWEGEAMTEAFLLAAAYTDVTLAKLFAGRVRAPIPDPRRERKRLEKARHRIILLRIPDYFEDAVLLAEKGGVDMDWFRDQFGGLARDAWDRYWHLAVKQLQQDGPHVYEHFEDLAAREGSPDAKLKGA